MSRWLLPAFIVLILASCEPYYEREFYERISGMQFPKTARAIESMDNGEFVTITVFKVDSLDLLEFMKRYQFKRYEEKPRLPLWGAGLLKQNKPDYAREGQYYQAGYKGKNSWLYLADPANKKLWAEIQYPDWAGD